MNNGILITQEIGSFRKPQYLSSVFRKTSGPELARLKEKATLETLELLSSGDKKDMLTKLSMPGRKYI